MQSLAEQKDAIVQIKINQMFNEMMHKDYFSFSAIVECAKLLGAYGTEFYKGGIGELLNVMHCVDFIKIPDETKESIPQLIQQHLSNGDYSILIATNYINNKKEFEIKIKRKEEEVKKNWFMSLFKN
ncbi:MAG: hypothetical protein V4629_03310 [Pseudomonadota bacterium]